MLKCSIHVKQMSACISSIIINQKNQQMFLLFLTLLHEMVRLVWWCCMMMATRSWEDTAGPGRSLEYRQNQTDEIKPQNDSVSKKNEFGNGFWWRLGVVRVRGKRSHCSCLIHLQPENSIQMWNQGQQSKDQDSMYKRNRTEEE